MTPPPLRRRRAKAKPVRAWAVLSTEDDRLLYAYLDGGCDLVPLIFDSENAAHWRLSSMRRLARVEIREIRTTDPKRGRKKKGKR